jgi:hypothetical protein
MGDATKNATNIVVDPLARLICIQEVPGFILVLANNFSVVAFFFYLNTARKISLP